MHYIEIAGVITENAKAAIDEYRKILGFSDRKVLYMQNLRRYFFSGDDGEVYLVNV